MNAKDDMSTAVNNPPTTAQEIERLEAWCENTKLEISVFKGTYADTKDQGSLLKALELCEQLVWAERYLAQFKQLENRRLVDLEGANYDQQ